LVIPAQRRSCLAPLPDIAILPGAAMSKPRDDRQNDLFRPPLERVIDLRHPLARLAQAIDWTALTARVAAACRPGPGGHPPLPPRLVAGLLILKPMYRLSDAALCERWLENPYFQFFCGETAFRHALPFDRSSLSKWRRRLGAEQVEALLQESRNAAERMQAPPPDNLKLAG
jgi:IS5 family transposase